MDINEYVNECNKRGAYDKRTTRSDTYSIRQILRLEGLEVGLVTHEWYSSFTHGPQDQSEQIIAITSSGEVYHNVWILKGIKKISEVVVSGSGAKALVKWGRHRPDSTPEEEWVCLRKSRR